MAYLEDRYNNAGETRAKNYDRFDPLLVGLHDSLREYQTGVDKNYSGLLESVASILDANLNHTEHSLAADVLIGLIKQVEADVRRNLADRLSVRENLHPSLLHYLAYDDIDVAESVLLRSPLLKETDLIYIIQAKTPDHWRAIAKRPNIGERVVHTLASKKDEQTSIGLLQNDTIELAEPILQIIATHSKSEENLAKELLNYNNLPREMAVDLYWHVSCALRQNISKKFDVDYTEMDQALQDCVQDFNDTILCADTMKPSTLMREVADLYFSQDKVNDSLLVSVLRRRQGRFFIALFAKQTNLTYDIVWNMMRQIGGQGLAVACKAMNFKKENFVSVFLLCRTITRTSQAVTAQELKMAMRYYDGLTYKMANEILRDSIAK